MSIPVAQPYPFDPTHGYDLARLEAVRPPPAPPGFDERWQARHAAALRIDPQPQLVDSAARHPDWQVQDLVYTSTDGFQIGGWLIVPQTGPVRRGLIVGHGYGGRDGPDFDLPVAETAVLFPCFRGLSRSARPPISSDPQWHILHEIDRPDRYILGGCVEDLWLAVSALTLLHPQVAGRIGYSGISLGGGVGALALPFDSRIARGQLTVPTFGDMPLWLTLPSVGSAQGAQAYFRRHPEVIETLRFYDSAVAAQRIAQPMLVAVARFDPAVAPPCQFSVANGLLPSVGHQTVILDAGHVDYPGEGEQHRQLADQVRRFFGAL